MVIYRAAHSGQLSVDFEDGDGPSLLVDDREAVRTAFRLVKEVTRKAGCSTAIICLSSVHSDSFRHRLWPGYKANRKDPKPEAYATVRQALEDEFEVYQQPGLEADDLMGIAATSEAAQCVVISWDKDMKTLPTLVYNPAHDARPVRIKLGIADQIWMKQAMTGDTIDNYPGIPGVGDAKAQEILLSPHRIRNVNVGKRKVIMKWVKGEPCSVWQSMLDYTTKAGLDEEHLIKMAQVSRILRAGDYDAETKTVRLWRPSGYTEMQL